MADLLTREGTDSAAGDVVHLPRLGPVGWARWAWRQLTSMRTALILLMLLAVAAVPGSVFPQRRIDENAVAAYLDEHTTAAPWLDRFGFFDVYTSPWFSAIYLLLFISLVGCVLPRSRQHWSAMRAAPPRTPRRFERLPAHTRFEVAQGATPEQVLAAARAALRRRRYRVAEYEGGASLSAEKGYLAETGNLVFHLSLVGLLVAMAFGSFTSYSGQILVVEGRTVANVLPSYDAFSAGSWVDTGDLPPFAVTLDSFKVKFESSIQGSQLGAPRQFDATFTVRDTPGATPRQVLVRPNQPLDVNGTRLFLVGNGYAPSITIRDGNGNVTFRGPVPAPPQDGNYVSLVVVKAPDATPRQIALAGRFYPTYDLGPDGRPRSLFPDALDPRLVLSAWAADPGQDGLGLNSGRPQSVYQLDPTNLTHLKAADGDFVRLVFGVGETVQLPDGVGSVTFDGLQRFASFDVRYDPTKGWVLGTSLLALVGVTVSLFVRRRRVWVRVVPAPVDEIEGADENAAGAGRTVVEVGGLGRGEDAGIEAEVEAVAGALRERAVT